MCTYRKLFAWDVLYVNILHCMHANNAFRFSHRKLQVSWHRLIRLVILTWNMHLSSQHLTSLLLLPSTIFLVDTRHRLISNSTHVKFIEIWKKKPKKIIDKPKTVIIFQHAPFSIHRCWSISTYINARPVCDTCKMLLFMANAAITFLFALSLLSPLSPPVFLSFFLSLAYSLWLTWKISHLNHKLTYIEQ